jgi:DNA-binding beta-propeller fold protein YncE
MRRLVFPLLVYPLLCLASPQEARADKVVLVAGGGTEVEDVPATKARLINPFGVDFDRSGSMFIAELTGQRVLRVDSKGVLTVLAGTGRKGDSGDGGPARKAQFNGMHNLAVAPNGDVYVADTWNYRVRKIDAKTGIITTIAGTGEKGYRGDGGPAAEALFGGIYCATFDPKGEKLYLADLDNRRIRVVNLKSQGVELVAGNGKRGVPEDGADARDAPLVDPRAVTVDAKGNVYILERGGHALRVVDARGKVRTVAGTGSPGHSGDGGDARKAALKGPKHLCLDLEGNVLIADTDNHVIRKYSPKDGTIVRVAGSGAKGSGGVGGPALQVQLNEPHGVYVHPSGTLYIADSNNHRVLKVER